jgi:hypothetical protein
MASDEQVELLREMRDLLRLLAEPALAKRDEKLRGALSTIVGKSKAKARAVVLMNGSRNQSAIRADSGIDHGDLSRLVKSLKSAALIDADEKRPKLLVSVPSHFFDNLERGRNG